MFTDEIKRRSETNLTQVLEEKAHAEGVLLSDEGKNYIQAAGSDSEQEALRVLHTLITKAKERYPREDGWIILNRERMHELRSQTEHTRTAAQQPALTSHPPRRVKDETGRQGGEPLREGVLNHVEIGLPVRGLTTSNAQAGTQTGQSPRETDPVPTFIGWLCDGESKEVFDFLRRLKSQGHSSKEFLTRVVCALDEMYRHRREGEGQCDTYTLLKTAHLDNKDIELTLELLAAGIDHSYERSHTGVKLACIRALDHMTKKNNTSSSHA